MICTSFFQKFNCTHFSCKIKRSHPYGFIVSPNPTLMTSSSDIEEKIDRMVSNHEKEISRIKKVRNKWNSANFHLKKVNEMTIDGAKYGNGY